MHSVRAIFLFFSYVVMSVLTTEWCCRIAGTGVKGTSFGVPLLFDPGRLYGFGPQEIPSCCYVTEDL